MQTIPSGFCPNEWNQAFGAFKRLVEHLDALQSILSECGDLTHADSDVDYIRQQLSSEVDTLQFMTSDAEKHWKPLSLAVASAAGRFSLSRPVDDVAWCSSLLNAAWTLHNGLRRELAGDDAALCIQRMPLHVSRIPNDINQWRDRITAELRAGSMCGMDRKEIHHDLEKTVAKTPEDTARTIAGDIVLINELTEEDRPSGEWANICGFSDDTFRNRMTTNKPGATWRIVENGSQRYRVHLEDLPQEVRGSKKQRDERLATIRR